MSLSVGPVTVDWIPRAGSGVAGRPVGFWGVELMDIPPFLRGPSDAPWFNDGDWSGVETPTWLAWISNNRSRSAAVWGATEELARRDALSVVVPAVLRREGLLDGHGALIAPDPARPDHGVFVTGLSGSGKSSLTVSCALGGARFLSDDSVAIGWAGTHLRAWPRRSAISLSPQMRRRLVPDAQGRVFEDKIVLDARTTFPDRYADSLQVCALVFLERGPAAGDASGAPPPSSPTRVVRIESSEAYRRVLMGHPILALDTGARSCFKVVRDLANLPALHMMGGPDLLDPQVACATLSALLPPR